MIFSEYLKEFDDKFNKLDFLDKDFYKNNIGVIAYCNKAKVKATKKEFSEEYIRARFVYAMVHSGMYPKENICVEFSFPKTKGTLNPAIIVFKKEGWLKDFEEKNYKNIRQNLLLIGETKKNTDTVEKAIENQLRPAMQENESQEKIFGFYFDKQNDILLFKKVGNSEVRRFNELKECNNNWNINYRDLLTELPSFDDLIKNNESITNVSKLKLNFLDAIDESNFRDLLSLLNRAKDKIQPTSNVQDLIVEFLTLKVYDEKQSNKDKDYLLQFYITKEEKKEKILEFRSRFKKLYENARKEYKNVLQHKIFSYLENNRPSDLNDEQFLIELIEIFQVRGILKTKNENFNQIIFNNFGNDKQKSDNGQFFTPIPIVKTIIKMLNPMKDEELCDPCCGICDFLAMAFRHSYRNQAYPETTSHFFGFDIEKSNLKLAELNLVLNGTGGAILRTMNSLSQKLLDDGSSISNEGDFTINNYYSINWEHKLYKENNIKQFNVIATNPPFGKGRDLKTGDKGKWDLPKETIELYETWREKKDEGAKELPNSMDMGVLFLENTYKLLKAGGRLGIVLSNSIASIKEWENIRKWLIKRMRIIALFDLPANTFGETGVATTVIIAYKPKENELHLLQNNYEVFIKEVENIGYEVKTKDRTICFEPTYIINEETFEKTKDLKEDFTTMINDYVEFLNRQEIEIKEAFYWEEMKGEDKKSYGEI